MYVLNWTNFRLLTLFLFFYFICLKEISIIIFKISHLITYPTQFTDWLSVENHHNSLFYVNVIIWSRQQFYQVCLEQNKKTKRSVISFNDCHCYKWRASWGWGECVGMVTNCSISSQEGWKLRLTVRCIHVSLFVEF